jgi:hypothetical protein
MKKSNAVMRVVGIILCSKIFFLASCSTGTWVGGKALSHWQARGDSPRFVQVMVVNHSGEIQYLSSRSEIENIERILAEFTGYIEEQDLPFSFLLPQGEGEIEINEFTRVYYSAKPLEPEKQEVMVRHVDDDYTRQSIYHAERHRITPVYSRVFGVGHVMAAWPYALVLSLMLYGAGWTIMRTRRASKPEEG